MLENVIKSQQYRLLFIQYLISMLIYKIPMKLTMINETKSNSFNNDVELDISRQVLEYKKLFVGLTWIQPAVADDKV